MGANPGREPSNGGSPWGPPSVGKSLYLTLASTKLLPNYQQRYNFLHWILYIESDCDVQSALLSPNSMTGTKVVEVAAKISLVFSPVHRHCFVDSCCCAIHLSTSLTAYEV